MSNGWIVYILRCKDGSLYTGITNDLTKRVAAHKAGLASKYTRTRLPVRVVYQEDTLNRSQALQREWAIKKLERIEKLRLIKSHGTKSPAV